MKTTPQKTHIRRYLENGGKLTPKAARNFWGCDRLSARIFDINEDYYNEWLKRCDKKPMQQIDKTMVKTESGAWVAQYFLVKEDTGWVNHFDF